MLNKVSNMMVQILIDKKIVDEDKREVYLYGAMLFLSSVLGILSILLLSIILFDFITFLVFIVFFIPLRIHAGGYHCKTYSCCFIVSNILFLLIGFSAKYTYSFVLFQIIASIITLFTVIAYSPVTNKYNPLSARRILINRKKSIYIMIFQCLVIFLLLSLRSEYIDFYTCIASYSGFTIAILMFIELIKERRPKNA